MSTFRFNVILPVVFWAALTHLTTAATPTDSPKFEKFKREMLPKVRHTVTVVGKLDSGKFGWWLSSQGWGLYLCTGTTNRGDFEKMNDLGKFSGHRVKVVGTLRHSDYRDSGTPLVSSIPEYFFLDVAEAAVSEVEIRHDDIAKPK